MVIDTSALLAILSDEPESEGFVRLIVQAQDRVVSAVSLLEAGLVMTSRKERAGAAELDALIARARIRCVAFDEEQAAIGRHAFERFGKGRHRAALNFGDCAAYALARTLGYPLLFKGSDFAHTDISAVIPTAS